MSRRIRICLAAALASCLATVLVFAGERAVSYSTNAKVALTDIAWQQRYGATAHAGGRERRSAGADGSLRGLAVDPQQNLYATGYSLRNASFDCVTWKFDRDGKLLWERAHEGGANDAGRGVAVDAQGNVCVGGGTSNGANDDFLILKYDAAGKLLWRTTYDSGGDDCAYGIAVDSQGNVYVTGTCWAKDQEWVTFRSEVNSGCGPPGRCTKGENWVTVKYDAAGKVLWQRSAPGFGAAVAVGAEDRVYAVGDEGGAIRAYDPAGRLLWQKENQLAEADWGWGATLAVATDAQGCAYVTGIVSSRATNDLDRFLIKYSPAGDVAWKRTYHDWGNDSGVAVAVNAENQVVLAVNDCLVRSDSRGKLLSSEHLGWVASALACDLQGNLYAAAVLGSADRPRHDLVILKLRK